jgi:hypothetical protein
MLHLYTNETCTEWVLAESFEDANQVMREYYASLTPEQRDGGFGDPDIDALIARHPMITQAPDDKVFGYLDTDTNKVIKMLPSKWAAKHGRGHLVSVEE